MKSVIFFSYSILEIGAGFEKYLMETSAYLSKNYNIQVKIITLNEKYFMKIAKILSYYYKVKLQPLENYIQIFEQQILKIIAPAEYIKCNSFKELKHELLGADIIYSKNEPLELAILQLLGIPQEKPVVLGVHTAHYYPTTNFLNLHNLIYNTKIYNLLTIKVKAFHVLNSSDEIILKKQFPNKTINKIYNPFDFDNYTQSAKNIDTELKIYSKHNIIWVGRFSKQKGIDRLVSVLNQSSEYQQLSDINWHIVGSGEREAEVIALAEKHNNIHYYGRLHPNKVPQLLSQAELFISTSYWEGFPYVLLEAQSFGIPVLAYKIPGCTDIIDSGVNGWLVDTETEFVNFLMDKKRMTSNTNIQQYIRHKFDKIALYQQLYDMFSNV